MALITFEAGETASSADVNNNFDYLNQKITAQTLVQVLNGVLGSTTADHVNVAWNAKEISGAYERMQTDKTATTVRMSDDGFEVLTTSATSGNLDSQLAPVFGLRATPNSGWMYLDPAWSMQKTNATPTSIEDYRLTYVHLAEPKALYERQSSTAAGTKTWSMWNYGIPHNAKMVRLMATVTTRAGVQAALELVQARSNPHKKYGFVVHGVGGGSSGGQGDVALGTGAYAGKFMERRTAGFESADLYLQGYFI